MKKITSTLLRLFASYSKLLIMIFILSVSGTSLKADDGYTYLKCGKKYIKFDGYNLKTNYNIRTQRFKDNKRIDTYTVNRIVARDAYGSPYILNRNTGELRIGLNCKPRSCEVISKNQLPQLNEEGKKF